MTSSVSVVIVMLGSPYFLFNTITVGKPSNCYYCYVVITMFQQLANPIIVIIMLGSPYFLTVGIILLFTKLHAFEIVTVRYCVCVSMCRNQTQ